MSDPLPIVDRSVLRSEVSSELNPVTHSGPCRTCGGDEGWDGPKHVIVPGRYGFSEVLHFYCRRCGAFAPRPTLRSLNTPTPPKSEAFSIADGLCEAIAFVDEHVGRWNLVPGMLHDYADRWLMRARLRLVERLDVYFVGTRRLSGEQQYQQAVTALAVRLKEAGLLLQDAAGFLRDKGHPKQAALAREKGRDAVAATEGLVD